uniref:Uncharacterized protein n=1 Tax=Populus trichocarpa TaxID=3694 RepID=A9PID4_POPTR|nr:unknown [Populus trichocarpa]
MLERASSLAKSVPPPLLPPLPPSTTIMFKIKHSPAKKKKALTSKN